MKCTRQVVATATHGGKYVALIVKKKGRMYQWGVLTAAGPESPRIHRAYATAGSESRASKEAVKAARRLFPGIKLAFK